MPASTTTFQPSNVEPSTSTPTIRKHPMVISIPGAQRVITRRSASNPSANINVFLVRDYAGGPMSTLKAAVTRNGRVMGLALKGHDAQVIDLEFLRTEEEAPIQVLASCDAEGVIFLWFLYVAKDKLGLDVGLRLLRKYSFYSLRKSTSAYYSRIRLAGTPENGTMVIVPNDGSNVRVITFTCQPKPAMNALDFPALPSTENMDTPLLLPPEHVEQRSMNINVIPSSGEMMQQFDDENDRPAAKYMPTPTASGDYSGAIEAEGKLEKEQYFKDEHEHSSMGPDMVGLTQYSKSKSSSEEEEEYVDADTIEGQTRNLNLDDDDDDDFDDYEGDIEEEEVIDEDYDEEEDEDYEEEEEEEEYEDDETEEEEEYEDENFVVEDLRHATIGKEQEYNNRGHI